MAGLTFSPGTLETALQVAQEPESVTQAIGLGNLAPSSADIAGLTQQSLARMQQTGEQALANMRRPPSSQSIIAFSRSANKFYAGGLTFAPDDVPSALQASQRLSQPTPPAPGNVAGDWEFVSPQEFGQYMQSLRAPRSALQNVALGFRSGLEGAIGGTGRALELAGATQAGPALAGFAEKTFGQTPKEQARSALIQQSNSFWSNLLDATAQGAGSLFPTLVGGLAGGAIGTAIGGPAGTAVGAVAGAGGTAARSIGALAGVAAATFPMELKGFYDAAQKNGYDVNDPGVQQTIIGSALGTTALQSVGPGVVIRGLSGPFREAAEKAGQEVARGALRNAATGAFYGGLSEGVAETVSSLAQNVVFDPEFRRKMNANDWKAIGPYVAEKYGEETLISFGAGALLGGAFGGAANFRRTGPVNLNDVAGEQAGGEVYGPPEMQGPRRPLEVYGPPEMQGPPRPPVPGQEFWSAGLGGAAGPELARSTTANFWSAGLEGTTGGVPPTPAPAQLLALPAPPTYVSPTGEAGVSAAPYAAPIQQPAPPGVQEAYAPGYAPGGVSFAPAPYPTFAPAPYPTYAPAPLPTPAPAPDFSGQGPMSAGLRRLLYGASEAQRARQEQEAVATRTAAAEPAMRAQAALEERTILDTEGASTGKNKLADDGRRRTIAGFNELTTEQQDRVLAQFDNDPQQFFDYVRNTKVPDARRALARAAGVEPEAFNVKTPAPAEPQPAAQPAPTVASLKKGQPSATQTGQQPEGRVSQRQDVGKGRPSAKTGRGDSLKQGRQEQAAVQTAPEVATETDRNVWDTYFDDGGVGYDKLPDAGKAEWRALVLRGDIVQAEADALQTKYTAPKKPAPKQATLTKAAPAPEPAPKKPVRKPRAAAPKEGALQRPPEGEAAPSPKPAESVETEATATAKANREQLRTTNEELGAVDERIKAIGKEFISAPNRATREKLSAERTVLEERRDALRDQRRGLEALVNGPKVDTAFGPGAIVANAKGKGETGRFSLKGYNTVTGAMGADNKALPPFPAGRVAMGVRRFLSGLATKPKVGVYRNQADLKARNPALYRQAKASLAAGVDFDAAPAAGFSFGDGNVLIFSDNITNDRHLNFVLAHETLGHFGMRGIMPGDKYNALMERLYEENPRIRAAVDSAMEARGLRKAEAVEEYLSDYAGLLETSVVKRVWDSIKGFLNKLGVRFGDEAMRYFLDQSKRYVRQGQQGVTFDAQAVADRLMYVENGANDTGRFSMASVRSDNEHIAGTFYQMGDRWSFNMERGLQALRDLGLNRREGWSKLKDQFLRLSNFKALDNPGAYAFDQLMNGMRMKDAAVYNKYNERLTTLYNAPKAHQDNVSRVLYGGRRAAIARFGKDPQLPNQRLVSLSKDGVPRADRKMIADMLNRGKMSFEEARDGLRFEVKIVDSLGNTQTDVVNYEGVKNLTKEQYADYERALVAMADVEAELLEAKYANLLGNETISRDAIKRIMKSGDFTAADTKFVDDTIKTYKQIYTTGMKVDQTGALQLDPASVMRSNEFIAAVNAAMIGKDTDRNAEVVKFFDGQPAADAFIERLMDFKSRRQSPEALDQSNQSFTFQNEIKNIVLASADLDKADRAVKSNIVKGYIPVLREGGHETRVQAFINGRPVTLAPEYQERLSYSQFDTPAGARGAADKLNAFFKGKTYEAIVIEDGAPVTRTVTLSAKYGQAIESAASDPSLNLEEFLYGLRLFGINPTPTVMADILTTLTETSNNARKKLQYSQTPGADPTLGVTAMSQHIRGRASTIAKTLFRPDMRQIMDRSIPDTAALWAGGRERVIALKKQVDAATGEAKKYAQRDLDLALRMFRKTNPDAVGKDGKAWDGSETNAPPQDEAGSYERGNRFYNEASDTLNFLDNNKYVTESNFESGKAVSYVRAFTTVMQLGGSVAQGVMNLASPITNWIPYMSSYNAKNSFGGGFKAGQVIMEYHRALGQVGIKGMRLGDSFNTAAFYDNIAGSAKLQTQYGINEREAKFLAREIREGKLIPAQSNALLATSLGHVTSPGMRKFVDAFMTPFNLSEQAARRAAGLAAYRMEYARAIAAGKSETDADARARDFAVQSIDFTLGEYAVLNRPPAWRQGLTSFLYMYKTYPTTVVQLMNNLSPKGRIGMLAALWVVSGTAGLPFAEDTEDLIDTLAQKFGFTSRGIRVEITKLLDEVFPGISPLVIKGAAATWLGLPADIGSRFSMGDLIPGTGILLAGAKGTEEIKDILGPAAGAILGSAQFAKSLLAVPFADSKTMALESAARTAPVTALRMLGDTSAYLQSGAVVDRRGYVVSQDMNAATIMTRLLGFYPSAAAEQYEVIKYANRMVNYQKEVTTGFREAWIRAKIRGDETTAMSIQQSVGTWNDATRGTGLEMRNWLAGSNKALREASRPAGERALRAAPTAARQDIGGIMSAILD